MSEGDLIEILQWVLSFKKLSLIGTFHDSLLEMLTPEDMKMVLQKIRIRFVPGLNLRSCGFS